MPLAMFSEDEKELGENFTRWWRDRSIPASRHELRKKMKAPLNKILFFAK